jgi:ABC-2 type transport system ATP-binding protein
MDNDHPIIKIENLSIEFGTVKALQNISLEISTGTIFGFLGPNGAGKTTTIRVLLGLLKPSHGKAFVFGLDTLTESDKIRQECGVLSEHNGLYEILSAEDNLKFYGRIWKMPETELKERIKELLNHIGLWDRRGENVSKWSKGMKQKLAIARCFLHHPSLIFLDEPTSGLDPEAASSLRNDLHSIVEKEGASIFLTTHNLYEAEKLCNQVGVINRGKLLVTGTPSDLKSLNEKNHRFEIIGKGISENILKTLQVNPDIKIISYKNGTLLIEIVKSVSISSIITEMVSAGAEIEESKRIQPTLENVYLTLMGESK